MSYIPGQEEIQDQRKNEYLQVCRTIQNRMPLGFEDPVGTHIFVRVSWQVIQEATGVGREGHDNAKKQMEECRIEVEQLRHTHDQGVQKHADLEEKVNKLQKEKAKEDDSAND